MVLFFMDIDIRKMDFGRWVDGMQLFGKHVNLKMAFGNGKMTLQTKYD